jgi:hypothetical protein
MNLKCDSLLSKFALKFSLYRYTEVGTQRSVKAASLLPLTALFKIGLPVLTHQETRTLAIVLRDDYERSRGNTAKVKANILEAIAALHDSLPQPGPLSVEKDAAALAAAEEKPPRPAEVKKAPTPEWLLKAGLATLTQTDGSTVLVAEGLDGISSALAALAAAAAAPPAGPDATAAAAAADDDGNPVPQSTAPLLSRTRG